MTTYPLSTYQVSVGGTLVPIMQGSLNIDLTIARRSTCTFDIEDIAGAWHFQQGQQILLSNAVGVLVYGGFVQTVREKKSSYGGALIHSVTGMDMHYLADKRIVASSYLAQTTHFIVNDVLTNTLAAEGVWAYNGANLFTRNQSDVETDLTGFSVAASNLITGDVAATINQDPTKAVFGATSLHMNTGLVTTGASGVEWSPGVAVAAGATVTVSFYYQTSLSGGALRVHDYTNNTSPAGISLTTPTTGWTRASYTWTQGGSATTDLRFCVRSGAQNQDFWFDGIQIEVAASASTWQPGQSTSIANSGLVVQEQVFNYESAASALDKMAKLDGYWWAIDERRVLWYQPYTGVPAPWVMDGTMAEYGTVTVDRGSNEFRNRQWVVGGKDKTTSQTNNFKGDGANRNFTCSYPLAQVPTITLNGVNQTVGIKGVDTGKQFYWQAGDAVVAQDASGTVLISTDTLVITYIGEFPIVAVSANSAQISAEQALEGGGTGYVESKFENGQIHSSAAAFQIANAQIAHYGQPLITLTFATMKSGLAPGQQLTVNLASHNLINYAMLVESINIADSDGYNIWYTVTCVGAAYDINWQTFWTGLLNRTTLQPNQGNSGAPTIVALLDSETVSITLPLSGSQTIIACPVPSPTLFPSATLFPC